jgi:uncharacterized membrane protein
MIYFLSALSGGFFPLIAIVLSVIAISRSGKAMHEVEILKKSMQGKLVTATPSPGVIASSAPVAEHATTVPAPVAKPASSESEFAKWLKEDWLLKLGGILVLMGVIFLLSIAFNSMGPQGKVMLGYLIGASLMAFGFLFARKNLIGGSVIHVVGAVIVMLTTYAAQVSYGMFDSFVSMMLMFFTSVIISLTAYVYKRAAMAHVGLLLALVVPILVGGNNGSFLDLMFYLSVVVLGVLWLAIVTEWRTLVLLAQAALCMYSFLRVSHYAPLQSGELLMVALFGGIFFITSVFSILRTQGRTAKVDGWIALLNAFYALGWILSEAPKEWQGILFAMIGLMYAVAFFFVYRVTKAQEGFVIYGSTALGMLIISVMLELSGAAETTALLLMVSGATAFTYYLSGERRMTWIIAIANAIPLTQVLSNINHIQNVARYSGLTSYGYDSLYMNQTVWQDFAVIALAIAVYALLARYLKSGMRDLSTVFFFASTLLAVDIVWQGFHYVIHGNFATFLSLIVYTLTGLVVLFQGSRSGDQALVKFGRIGLGLVALRVILVDAWSLGSTTVGIIVCVVIGLLLLSSTFITKKNVVATA